MTPDEEPAPAPEETRHDAAATAEAPAEAPAEAAAEAPAEQAPAEEAPAPVEDAPAEDAPTEESSDEAEGEAQPVITPIMEGNLPSTHRSDIAASEDVAAPKKAKKKAARKAAPKLLAPGKLVAPGKKIKSRLPDEVGLPTEEAGLQWYVVRVQSGREGSVKKALDRKIREMNLGPVEDDGGEKGAEGLIYNVLVPTESVVEVGRDGKRRTVTKKLYPGYVMCHMVRNEKTQQTIRRISGVGDFVSANPMSDHEVETLLRVSAPPDAPDDKKAEVKIAFQIGQKVKIKEGPFENFDGDVKEINTDRGTVKVAVSIFGRETSVDIEYWKVEEI